MLRARVLLVLADAHVELGEISRAEELLHDAEAAGPAVAPVVRASRGVLLARTGRMRPARRELDTAIGELERTNPAGSNLVRALLWRGLLHLTESRLDEAAADCEAARQLGSRRGMDAAVVIATHTEGIVHFLSGDLPGALHLMSQADEQPLDVRVGFRALDRARVLLAAGLTAEARDFARRAGEAFLAERARVDLAETLLVQAEIDLMDRRPPRAALAASRAARIYAGAHHARGVLAARLMQARADALDRVVSRIRDRRRARADAARAATLADDLAAAGLVEDARAARVLEADARLAAGDLDQAEQTLARARSESAAQFVAVPTVATELHGRLVAARTELARGPARGRHVADAARSRRSRLLPGAVRLPGPAVGGRRARVRADSARSADRAGIPLAGGDPAVAGAFPRRVHQAAGGPAARRSRAREGPQQAARRRVPGTAGVAVRRTRRRTGLDRRRTCAGASAVPVLDRRGKRCRCTGR